MSTLWLTALLAGLGIVAVLVGWSRMTARRSRHIPPASRQYELMLLRLGEARGRQEVLDDVRMLEHGQLKTHVLAVQRCLVLARDATSEGQRERCLDEGLSQTRRLLDVVVMLHQASGRSALPSDLEQTVADVAQSLSVAYPQCSCRVEVTGQRPDHLSDPLKRALLLVLYNGLSNAYRHGCPTEVAVLLQYAPDALILVVRDDGQGLASSDKQGVGRGLRDMRHLVAEHNGMLRIASAPGMGTQMRATFPLKGEDAESGGHRDATDPVHASAGRETYHGVCATPAGAGH